VGKGKWFGISGRKLKILVNGVGEIREMGVRALRVRIDNYTGIPYA